MSETDKQPENMTNVPPEEAAPEAINVGDTPAASPEQSPPDAAPGDNSNPEAQIAELTAQNTDLTEQRNSFQNQYIRIAADFDNFRKRTIKEKEELELKIKCATIMELLAVVDNFERARTQIKPQNDGEMEIHKSYQGVYKQLVEALKKSGVAPMRSEGQPFDPNLHEAVMRQPTDEHPEGTVLEELQRGYFLGERILRHALVKVAMPIEQLTVEDAEAAVSESTPN
jgi:molecular chaperone GrpE